LGGFCEGFFLLFWLFWDLGLPLYTKFALEEPAIAFPHVSFALAFSSTSRVTTRSSKVNSFLFCFREVAKSLQDCGNLAIIAPATNFSGNTYETSLL
jgi:hypothetical protein